MNILYLSHLSGVSYAGPTYSVPKQIEAQSRIDNVFWYNAIKSERTEWKSLPFYHDIEEYPKESIKSLPEPFNHPDLIVAELFYNMFGSPLIRELVNGCIPYVIVPRGELTAKAQKRKVLKKVLANCYICRRYARKAAAIQYLTSRERADSGEKWNSKGIVIPNGIDNPDRIKTKYSESGIKCISIGRIEPYQKGLDLLIEACFRIKRDLVKAGCSVTICGPDNENRLSELRKDVYDYGLEKVVFFHDGVFGKEKEELILDSDVFLIASRFEGHPMALIEALSYGLPCIATDGSNMREEVDSFKAGWTCDSSVDGICSALLAMLEDRNHIREYGEKAIVLSNQYNWNTIAERTHREYIGLLE